METSTFVLHLRLFMCSSSINYAPKPQDWYMQSCFLCSDREQSIRGHAQRAYGALVSLLKYCGKLQRRTKTECNKKTDPRHQLMFMLMEIFSRSPETPKHRKARSCLTSERSYVTKRNLLKKQARSETLT